MRRHALGQLLVVVMIAVVGALIGSCPAAAAAPNPQWPARCPQRVVIVLDLSSSIDPYLPEVRKSADDLVDALRGAHNGVAVVIFGTSASVAVPLLDVGDDAQRAHLKDLVDGVGLSAGDGGATNWEEALNLAASLQPNVVLLLTDGMPTVHGNASTGYSQDTDSLAPAVQVADRMRRDGTRIVGVGMGLQQAAVPNLVEVSGPKLNDDYYETGSDAAGLLDKLYDVAGKTCGIPVGALPQPEGGRFPVVPVIVGALAFALLAALGGYLWSRRRDKGGPPSAPRTRRTRQAPLRDGGVALQDVPQVATNFTESPYRDPNQDDLTTEHAPADPPRDPQYESPTDRGCPEPPAPPKPPRRSGRMSLDRLHRDMDARSGEGTPSHDRRSRGPAPDEP